MKFLAKVWKKKQAPQTQDEISRLIQRLCDPTDILYDKEFAKGLEEESR